MNTALRSLSALEATALVQIKLQAHLDSRLRGAAHRLIKLGIVDEDPNGMYVVTRLGEEYLWREAVRLGLAPPAARP
jgi:hypothetical protein